MEPNGTLSHGVNRAVDYLNLALNKEFGGKIRRSDGDRLNYN